MKLLWIWYISLLGMCINVLAWLGHAVDDAGDWGFGFLHQCA